MAVATYVSTIISLTFRVNRCLHLCRLCEALPGLNCRMPLGYIQENDSMKELNKIIDKSVEGVS